MEFLNWFLNPVRNHYADFEGRTSRQEFWMFILVYFLVVIAVALVSAIVRIPFLYMLFMLAMIIPNFSITARRLHDTNRSGWWQLITLIPIIGAIILIVFLIQKGQDEGNRYGISSVVVTAPVSSISEEVMSSDSSMPETVSAVAPVEANKQQEL